MIARLQSLWQSLIGGDSTLDEGRRPTEDTGPEQRALKPVDIGPNDPLVAYFQSDANVVEVNSLNLDSPAVRALKAAGVRIAMPLVSQGELVGLLSLGPRQSEQEYSTDDRRLLGDLAIQAAPSVRIAQLALQQQFEVMGRERLEQELQVARVIQQTLLPESVPDLPGW